MIGHDSVRNCKPKSRSIGSGCEIGIEQARQILRWNTDTLVGKGEVDEPMALRRTDSRGDADNATVWHSLHGVNQDVKANLLKLGSVPEHDQIAAGKIQRQRDLLLLSLALKKPDHLQDRLVD